MSRARDIADGTLNSADINGGNIDNTTIGGTDPAAGTFTTFTSTGIDDKLTSGGPAITIDSSGNVGIGTTSPTTTKLQINYTAASENGLRLYGTNTGQNNAIIMYDASSNSITQGINAGAYTLAANGTERLRIDSSGNLKFNSGYGSVATAYGCRAWVNFDGTSGSGTGYSDITIRGSGNVSSITDNGTGQYTVNFTTAMPDGNYSVSALGRMAPATYRDIYAYLDANTTPSSSSFKIIFRSVINNGARDCDFAHISVVR